MSSPDMCALFIQTEVTLVSQKFKQNQTMKAVSQLDLIQFFTIKRD